MKVLIVEDNLRWRQELQACLQGLTRATRECADGDEALAAYRAFRPDWVLMDVEMQRLDGISASRAITAAAPAARICIVTIHNDELLREAARAAGACAFVLKDELFRLREIVVPPAAPAAPGPSVLSTSW